MPILPYEAPVYSSSLLFQLLSNLVEIKHSPFSTTTTIAFLHSKDSKKTSRLATKVTANTIVFKDELNT